MSNDTAMRRLCHTLFDAIERGDLDVVAECYAPDMSMWFNITGEVSTKEENLAALVAGKDVARRRLYNDRVVNTFDDGFVVQYTTHVVTHGGGKLPLQACLVAEVHDEKIVRMFEYLDSSKFVSS
jgi:ketosteroid isomerase-like protein